MRADQRPGFDLPPQTRVSHACCGGLEVRGGADGGEVDLRALGRLFGWEGGRGVDLVGEEKGGIGAVEGWEA